MNELTIEQLKSLEVGDWVWVVSRIGNTYGQVKGLGRTALDFETFDIKLNGDTLALSIMDYGKTWLAYKNKELAEAEGEIVEFNCKLGDTVYFYDFTKHEVMQGKVIGLRLNYYTPSNPIWVRVQFDIPMVKKDCVTEVWASMVFTDKNEAERRLAELTKE